MRFVDELYPQAGLLTHGFTVLSTMTHNGLLPATLKFGYIPMEEEHLTQDEWRQVYEAEDEIG